MKARPLVVSCASLVMAASLVATLAHAGDGDAPLPHWEIEGTLGLGTSVGAIGAQIAYAPPPFAGWLALQVGAGVNTNVQGQFSSMLRARIPWRIDRGFVHVDLAGGVSGGRFTTPEFDLDASGHSTRHWSFAEWGNAEASVTMGWIHPNETVAAYGVYWYLRFFVGAAKLLNPGRGECTGTNDCDDPPNVLPYFGFAVGTAL